MTGTATGTTGTPPSHAQQPAPHSCGTESPRLGAPANSCDCHMHIYDNRFPAVAGPAPLNFPVNAYRLLQKRIGTTRTVIVSPKVYGTDHRCTLDAISQLGSTATRGIAVVHPNVTDADLRRLADAGIRGIRFTVGKPAVAVTTIDMIEPLAKRIDDLGWHVQIHMLADQIVENADLLQRVVSPIVFDHMGRLPQPAGIKHAAFQVIRRLLDKGRTWVKLSGAVFPDSKLGSPTYADLTEIAEAYIKAAPERMVWGSDSPHALEKEMPPDDVVLFDLLAQWAQDEPTRRRILVDNPEALYGFPKSV
ncbi:MAG: amidohydrolase family protein [Betaproteobacteria bacterium]|nr:amidohydrolase family protein [Betaproteobacteria bacterium]